MKTLFTQNCLRKSWR